MAWLATTVTLMCLAAFVGYRYGFENGVRRSRRAWLRSSRWLDQ